MSERGTFCNIGTPVWPIRFCPKTCHVGGRLIAAPTFGACNVGGRMISTPTLACARWRASATEFPERKFQCVVGVVLRAANQNPMIAGGDHTIIQRLSAARLFPRWGNNVGAKRRQWHHQTFYNEIQRHYVGTWYILQHRNPGLANTVLPKNLPRWRAANSRPYVWCVQRWQAG